MLLTGLSNICSKDEGTGAASGRSNRRWSTYQYYGSSIYGK